MDNKINKIIGGFLRTMREAAGLSQQEMAEKIYNKRQKQSVIHNHETGKSSLLLEDLAIYARAFEKTPFAFINTILDKVKYQDSCYELNIEDWEELEMNSILEKRKENLRKKIKELEDFVK